MRGNDEGPSTHELEGPCRVPRAAVADRSASIGLAGPAPRAAPLDRSRCRSTRNPRPTRSAGADRSVPAPSRSTCPTSETLPIARLRLRLRSGIRREVRRSLAPSTPRNPSPVPETRLPATVSRGPAASWRLPSRSVSVSGDKESSSGVRPAGTRGFPQLFRQSPVSTGRSTAGDRVVPRTDRLSTARPRARPHPPLLMSTMRTPIRAAATGSEPAETDPASPLVVDLRAVPAATPAAGAAGREQTRREHEQPGRRVEVAGIAVRQRARCQRVDHRLRVGGCQSGP